MLFGKIQTIGGQRVEDSVFRSVEKFKADVENTTGFASLFGYTSSIVETNGLSAFDVRMIKISESLASSDKSIIKAKYVDYTAIAAYYIFFVISMNDGMVDGIVYSKE